MKNPNQYSGKNPIPGPKRFGNHKGSATPAVANVVAVDPPANDDAATAVAITSIEAKAAARPDANVVVAAKQAPCVDQVDALEGVKSGEQILADIKTPAAKTRPAS